MTQSVTAAVPVGSGSPPLGRAVYTSETWRPVQYLGSKLRAMGAIVSTASTLTSDGTFWDAFTGSSVVAQGAASAGFEVWATDTQRSSVVFAATMLGERATTASVAAFADVIADIAQAPHPDEHDWASCRAAEDALLSTGDYDGLIDLYAGLPQRWRTTDRWNRFAPLTSTFAGTYLSIRQAMTLDAARIRLQALRGAGRVDDWTHAAALTAMCHAASEAVHSAGKHFAQPLQPATVGAPNYTFIRGRSLKDRSVSVEAKMMDAAHQISERVTVGTGCTASNLDVARVTVEDLKRRGVSVVYSDPPYTAQQYSRFYHLLETLVAGVSEPIQSVKGKPPKGLYPADRYMSPFCSRRQAPAAFQHLVRTSHAAGAHLLLSYSTTGSTSGNQRTIGEADLLAIVGDIYSSDRVSVIYLDYGYRQFNRDSRRTDTYGTGELLIVGEAR